MQLTRDAKSLRRYVTKGIYPDAARRFSHHSVQSNISNQYKYFSEFDSHPEDRPPESIIRAYEIFMRQSEFKKPYKSPGYQEMETVSDTPPGISTGHPQKPDNPARIDINEPIVVAPQAWILDAFSNDVFCPGLTTEIEVSGTHPIYDLQVVFPKATTTLTILGGLGTNVVVANVFADEDEFGLMSIRAYERAFDAPPSPSQQGKGWTGFSIGEGDCNYRKYILISLDMEGLTDGVKYWTVFNIVDDIVADDIPDGVGGFVSFPISDLSLLDPWLALPGVSSISGSETWGDGGAETVQFFGPIAAKYRELSFACDSERCSDDSNSPDGPFDGFYNGAPVFSSEYPVCSGAICEYHTTRPGTCVWTDDGNFPSNPYFCDVTSNASMVAQYTGQKPNLKLTNATWGDSSIGLWSQTTSDTTYENYTEWGYNTTASSGSQTASLVFDALLFYVPIAGKIGIDLLLDVDNTHEYTGDAAYTDPGPPISGNTSLNKSGIYLSGSAAGGSHLTALAAETSGWLDGSATRVGVFTFLGRTEVYSSNVFSLNLIQSSNFDIPGRGEASFDSTYELYFTSGCGVDNRDDLAWNPRDTARSTALEAAVLELFNESSDGLSTTEQNILDLEMTGQFYEWLS